jgi:hypothetical protein
VTLDSGQPIPPPAVRAEHLRQRHVHDTRTEDLTEHAVVRESLQLRLDRAREARAKGLPWYGDVIDTLPRGASPAQMTTWCRNMEVVLRVSGRSDEAAAGLLNEVSHEEEAVRRIWPALGTTCLAGALGGALGPLIGIPVGYGVDPNKYSECGWLGTNGSFFGCLAGGVAGPVIGMGIGAWARVSLIARHRNRVNNLARRVNRAVVASSP